MFRAPGEKLDMECTPGCILTAWKLRPVPSAEAAGARPKPGVFCGAVENKNMIADLKAAVPAKQGQWPFFMRRKGEHCEKEKKPG